LHLERESAVASGSFVNLLELWSPDDGRKVAEDQITQIDGSHWNSYRLWNHKLLPTQFRHHKLVKRYQDALGFTAKWRLELCVRASNFPVEPDWL